MTPAQVAAGLQTASDFPNGGNCQQTADATPIVDQPRSQCDALPVPVHAVSARMSPQGTGQHQAQRADNPLAQAIGLGSASPTNIPTA